MERTKGMFRKTKETGITLIALVITIIILIILAAVSIRAITGDSSLIGKAQSAKLETAKSSVIDDARLAYSAIYVERTSRGDGSEVKLSEVVKLMQEENAEYKKSIKSVAQNSVSSITPSQTSVKVKEGQEIEVEITTNAGENTTYYANIQGKYYPISLNNGNIKLGEGVNSTDNGITLSANSSSSSNAEAVAEGTTVKVKGVSKGTSKVTVSYGGTTTEIEVTVVPNYGQVVDLGTVTVGGNALENNWLYYFNDDSNIYLIYNGILEGIQIPKPNETIVVSDNTVKLTTNDPDDYLKYLKGEGDYVTTWKNFEDGVKTALTAKGISADVGVKVTGSPSLEEFRSCFNSMYPEYEFTIRYINVGETYGPDNSYTAKNAGYVLKRKDCDEGDWKIIVALKNDPLIISYPGTSRSYRVADRKVSTRENYTNVVFVMDTYGTLGDSQPQDLTAIRPVIKITKTNAVNDIKEKLGLK